MNYKHLAVSTFIIGLGLFTSPTETKAAPTYTKISESSFILATTTSENLAIFTITFEISDVNQDVYVPIKTNSIGGHPYYHDYFDDSVINYGVDTFHSYCPEGEWCGSYTDPKARGIVLSDAAVIKNSVYLVPKGTKKRFSLAVFLPYKHNDVEPGYGTIKGELTIDLIPIYLEPLYLDGQNKYTFVGRFEDGETTIKKTYETKDLTQKPERIRREASATVLYSELSTKDMILY